MGIPLLGPVRIRAGHGYLDIGSAKPRLVLAALVAFPGVAVPLNVLADRVWADLPRDPAAGLYPYLSQLQRALVPAEIGIVRTDGGYLCDVSADRVDMAQFRGHLVTAQEVPKDESGCAQAVELVDAALDLWRGEPLADLDGDWPCRHRESLRQERLAALILRAGHHQRLGQFASTADLLLEAAGDYPLSEPLACFVVRALAVAGRRAEALDYYARMRGRLADELGEEPGDELRELHLCLLRRDPGLATEQSAAWPPVVPRRLPTATRRFAGRTHELGKLDDGLGLTDRPAAVVVSAVSGAGESARPRWSCTGRTSSGTASPTVSCSPTCAATVRRTRSTRPSRYRRPWRPGPRCFAATWPTGACLSSWTTSATLSRCGRCCRAAADRSSCSPVATSYADCPSTTAPNESPWTSSPTPRGSPCWPSSSVRTGSLPSLTLPRSSSRCAPGCRSR